MGDILVHYDSIDSAVIAYNRCVRELSSTIDTFEEKTRGIAKNGEVWGGTAADVVEGIIKGVREKIKELNEVTEKDAKTVNAVGVTYKDAEDDIVKLYDNSSKPPTIDQHILSVLKNQNNNSKDTSEV